MMALLGLIVLAFVVAVTVLTRIAADQDRDAMRQSRALQEQTWNERRNLLATTLEDYANWGAAYANLHATVNVDWAYYQANLGDTVFNRLGVTHVFVVGPDDRTRYALIEGRLSDQTAEGTFGPEALRLVARAREAGGVDASVVTPSLMAIDGAPALVVAAAIATGDDTTVAAVPGPASVMVFAERMDPARLAKLGADHFVWNLRMARDASDAAAEPAARLSFEGDGPVTLRWDPERPGQRLLDEVAPWVLASGAAMLLLLGLFLHDALHASRLVRSGTRRLQAAYDEVRRQAMHDPATGLPNRLMLAGHLEGRLTAGARDFALLFLDLDRFKPVNDAHGHAVGDQVLREVADRLKHAIGPADLVARVGGDEFVVAATGLDRHGVADLCRTLIAAVSAPIRHAAGAVHLGLSIGVAFPEDACDANELLRRADLALYEAKQKGRRTFRFYAAGMTDVIRQRRELEAELRGALARDEFILEFQPRYEARALRLRRVEALLRWRHPARGVVPPAAFIPLAEETGLIVPIGTWVLRQACLEAARWPGIGVSVNVSPVQIRGDDLLDSVAAALAESGLPPERLEIEVTESVLLEDVDRARAKLVALKALGVRLAMDDFGTGHSSLGYLHSFPFDVIKIDRRFVADLEPTGGSRAIVQAILGLGRALGLSVTAEGVETADQLLLLRLDGCDEVQGFHLARPQSAEDVAALIRDASAPVADEAPPPLAQIVSGR